MAIPSAGSGKAESGGGSPPPNPPNQKRKSKLGRARAYMGAATARFRHFRTDRVRYLQRLKRIPDKSKASQWLAFLNNHREAIVLRSVFLFAQLLRASTSPWAAMTRATEQ